MGFKAITPLKLKANRSMLPKRVGSFIYDKNSEEIKSECMARNEDLDITVILYKFPNSPTIKKNIFKL